VWLIAWLLSWCARAYRWLFDDPKEPFPPLTTEAVLRDEFAYLHQAARLQTDSDPDDQPTGPAPLLTKDERAALGAVRSGRSELAAEEAYLFEEMHGESPETVPAADADERLRGLFSAYGEKRP
jgi:hypothetical protein